MLFRSYPWPVQAGKGTTGLRQLCLLSRIRSELSVRSIGEQSLRLVHSLVRWRNEEFPLVNELSGVVVTTLACGSKLLVQIHILECVVFDGGFQAKAASKGPPEEEVNQGQADSEVSVLHPGRLPPSGVCRLQRSEDPEGDDHPEWAFAGSSSDGQLREVSAGGAGCRLASPFHGTAAVRQQGRMSGGEESGPSVRRMGISAGAKLPVGVSAVDQWIAGVSDAGNGVQEARVA